MDLKLNKLLSIILTSILFSIYFFGLPILSKVFELINNETQLNISIIDLFIAQVKSLTPNLSHIIIGSWFLLNAEKLKLEKWTWLLIGLVYGQYGLILFGAYVSIQYWESKTHLIKIITPILILLILSSLLSVSFNYLIVPYFTYKFSPADYGCIIQYDAYLSFIIYGILILTNICLAIKLNHWIKPLNMNNKYLWFIATLFLGLFPVIIIKQLTIKNNKNEA